MPVMRSVIVAWVMRRMIVLLASRAVREKKGPETRPSTSQGHASGELLRRWLPLELRQIVYPDGLVTVPGEPLPHDDDVDEAAEIEFEAWCREWEKEGSRRIWGFWYGP